MGVTPVGATKSSIIAPTPQGIPPYSTVGMKSASTNLIIITCVCGSALMITLGIAAVVMILVKRKRNQLTGQQQIR